MKIIFTHFLFCFSFLLSGQQLEKEVLTTSGGFALNSESNINIHWSVGEVATSTLTNGAVHLTQGFHQLDILIDPVFAWPDKDIEITVFPNPTSEAILLRQTGGESFDIRLVDIFGKNIFHGQWKGDEYQIDVSHLPDQTYALTIASDQKMQSFKIVKQSK